MAVPAESKPTFLLGVRYGERKHDPPPGLVWRKVQKDETLGTIADEYGVRWMDIALYNWHTIKLLEINWYLNHYLHCTLNNGTTYMFSGKESSGKEKGAGCWCRTCRLRSKREWRDRSRWCAMATPNTISSCR